MRKFLTKVIAQSQRVSMNEYPIRTARTATDPPLSTSAVEEIRARLRLAGYLSDFDACDVARPDEDAVSAARQRAGRGTPLSELVRANR